MGIQEGIHRVLMPISLQSMPDRVVKGIEQSINQRYPKEAVVITSTNDRVDIITSDRIALSKGKAIMV